MRICRSAQAVVMSAERVAAREHSGNLEMWVRVREETPLASVMGGVVMLIVLAVLLPLIQLNQWVR